jgi:preprotein translocase subunit SecG
MKNIIVLFIIVAITVVALVVVIQQKGPSYGAPTRDNPTPSQELSP